MADRSAERRQLLEEIRVIDAKINTELERISGVWNFSLGPFKMTRKASAMFITQIYTVFNMACLIAGIALAFIGSTFTAIGVALIVGAVFSFGTFATQLWAVQAQDEINIQRKLSGDAYQARLKILEAERLEIYQRIENLREP